MRMNGTLTFLIGKETNFAKRDRKFAEIGYRYDEKLDARIEG